MRSMFMLDDAFTAQFMKNLLAIIMTPESINDCHRVIILFLRSTIYANNTMSILLVYILANNGDALILRNCMNYSI